MLLKDNRIMLYKGKTLVFHHSYWHAHDYYGLYKQSYGAAYTTYIIYTINLSIFRVNKLSTSMKE